MKRWICVLLAAMVCIGLASGCVGCNACSKERKADSKYEITVEYAPENGMLTGVEKLTFENGTDEAFSTLQFALYPNAYRKDALYKPVSMSAQSSAYYAGESYGEMVVSSVNGAKSWEVLGEDENVLYAHLEKPLYPGDKVVLDIGFMVRLAKVRHRTGITENTVNLGNFFPILCGVKKGGFYETAYYDVGNPFYSDFADFTVTVKTPKEYVVVGSGEQVLQRTLESRTETTFTLVNARDFALVLSTDFRVLETDVHGKALRYYYYADEKAAEHLEMAKETFAYYTKTFGAYPYATYTLVQTGYCDGGAAYPTLTMLSDELQDEKYARVLAHETARQWWYAVVGSDAVENAWQDDGLAAYSAILFFNEHEKYGLSRERMVNDALKEYRGYYDVYGSVLGRTDTAMKRHLQTFINGHEYRCIALDKGVVMLDMLRKSVGDKKFFAALKKYYKENAFCMVDEYAFIGAFEKTGLDVHGFFDGFLSGKGVL